MRGLGLFSGTRASFASSELTYRIAGGRAVVEHSAQGVPALEDLARDLGVSRRSISRSLSEQNVRYREICIRVRHRLAVHFLERTSRPIKEIAAATGYTWRAVD